MPERFWMQTQKALRCTNKFCWRWWWGFHTWIWVKDLTWQVRVNYSMFSPDTWQAHIHESTHFKFQRIAVFIFWAMLRKQLLHVFISFSPLYPRFLGLAQAQICVFFLSRLCVWWNWSTRWYGWNQIRILNQLDVPWWPKSYTRWEVYLYRLSKSFHVSASNVVEDFSDQCTVT